MTKLGIGVLSFAHGHIAAYCSRLVHFDDARLVAAWDDDPQRLAEQSRRFGCETARSPEELVSRRDVDAVLIGIETYRHADMVELAAEAGKHILLQKPMALALEDCDRIIQAVRRSGVLFSMAWQMRHDPMNLKIKELVENGTLGKIGIVRRRHCLNMMFRPEFLQTWHVDPIKNRGMFMDDASHAADFLLWLLGRPVSVMAEIGNVLVDFPTEDTGVAIYRFESGAMGILLNSSVTWAGENTCEVYGSEGVLIQNHDDGPSTHVRKGIPHPIGLKLFLQSEAEKGWQDLGFSLPQSHGERIQNVIRPFIDYLRDPSRPHATAEEGKLCVEMLLGAYRSAQEGRRVALPLTQE